MVVMIVFLAFLSSSRQILGYRIKFGHDSFFQRPVPTLHSLIL
jgi:hypothetical protein